MSTSRDPRPPAGLARLGLTGLGLIGLGHMGAAVAERLICAGYDVVVWNRTPEKAAPLTELGATFAAGPSELAAGVALVLTSLSDDGAFESVAADVVSSARPGTVLADLSTVSPGASARVAAIAEAAGVHYLRAPVSGNPSVVRAGNLSFIVSGPAEALQQVEPVLLAIGRSVHDVGRGEEARIVKLAVNLVIAGLAQLMAEALVLGEASGVSRAALLEVLCDSAAGAPFVKYKAEPLLRDDYSATFTTALMEKDVDLILEAADDAGVDLPVGGQLKSLLHATADAGYADHDFMALLLHLRDTPSREAVR